MACVQPFAEIGHWTIEDAANAWTTMNLVRDKAVNGRRHGWWHRPNQWFVPTIFVVWDDRTTR